ncbi:MAG TPA: response regulator [Polyangia bacterium]|nr:response regulator [Polyangia bacterium]
MQVLLVEDEPGYARFLREVLIDAEGAPYRITSAGTLEAALGEIARQAFDVVLLDLGLPDADGTEALERVAAAAPGAPIVVLSALHDLDVALESMRAGAQEYLVKGQAEHLLLPRAIRYAVERKRLQTLAAAARAEAERANAVKDDFLAMLGHELRNPLAPIVNALALMRRQGAQQVERERSIIDRQVRHLVQLVDDLLDVSRIARGKLEIRPADVDVADLVADGLEIARPVFDKRRHEVEIDVPRGQLYVHGDRARLVQVVANLLTNAAKYTNAGGKVAIAARDEGGTVSLSVRDNGIGIAASLLPRVFDLFAQGERSLDRAGGGLGLGLAIVKSIVTLHGGTVSVSSGGLGQGSEFIVRLPSIAPSDQPEAPVIEAPRARPDAPRRRVLIVDDNEEMTEMLEAVLQAMGHTTRTANDGPSGLAAAESFQPEVALVDIGLPVMDGYELARQMRARLGDRVPVLIAVSGYGQEADRARSREAGFDHHLVKPVPPKVFEDLFASLQGK